MTSTFISSSSPGFKRHSLGETLEIKMKNVFWPLTTYMAQGDKSLCSIWTFPHPRALTRPGRPSRRSAGSKEGPARRQHRPTNSRALPCQRGTGGRCYNAGMLPLQSACDCQHQLSSPLKLHLVASQLLQSSFRSTSRIAMAKSGRLVDQMTAMNPKQHWEGGSTQKGSTLWESTQKAFKL